jgi:A/G-specific adenine glycosylase
MFSDSEILEFRRSLLSWFELHRRDLPWRRTRDPYAIWISEIMLQQTRVAAVIPYYERFMSRFPSFTVLAEASESDLLAHWAGLGYYYRARNLQKAARQMEEAGHFPDSYEEILSLPGVGEYTAAAVASIGFNLPHAVVDGNVFRVLSRVFDDSTNIASSISRKHFGRLAGTLLDTGRPGDWNQALMELGATVCLPKKPQCLICPVAAHCRARANSSQQELPVKTKLQKNRSETRVLFWAEQGGKVLLWQRPSDSRLMPGFWELPELAQFPSATAAGKLGSFRHGITIHNFTFEVMEIHVPEDIHDCQWIALGDLHALPVSTIVKKAQGTVHRFRQHRRTSHAAAPA